MTPTTRAWGWNGGAVDSKRGAEASRREDTKTVVLRPTRTIPLSAVSIPCSCGGRTWYAQRSQNTYGDGNIWNDRQARQVLATFQPARSSHLDVAGYRQYIQALDAVLFEFFQKTAEKV